MQPAAVTIDAEFHMPAALTTDPLEAARLILQGGVVAFPTETVYGLGAHAELPDAVARVYAIKGRPAGHPLIIHGADASVLDRYALHADRDARRLAEALWPGPLTLVVARNASVAEAATGGRDTVGLRVPDQPLARAMLAGVDAGVAAPSANLFGRTSPTTAAHVAADLGGDVDLILDGGPCAVGVESTILDLSGPVPTLLRSGGISPEVLEALLGRPIERTARGPARAPGMLPAHYAPQATVVLTSPAQLRDELARQRLLGRSVAVLAQGRVDADGGRAIMLRPAGDRPEDFARDLYGLLRAADDRGVEVIIAVPPTGDGIAAAVRDRLERAAAAAVRG